jgi:predicted MFS family arabinose efflux permease
MLMIGRYSATSLFSFGLITTNLALLATGLIAELWWQTLWRILAGFFGAMSFSTAGALAAGLFPNDPRRNALAIAILFGTGGGLAIVLSGASLPLFLDHYGADHWPLTWVIIAAICLLFLPLCLWSAAKLKSPAPQQAKARAPLPISQIWAQLAGYAGFGLGYIVFLTFLSAWMTQQAASASFSAAVWILLGLSICISPLVWRAILARHASGLPLAMILTCIALGSSLPVLFPGNISLLIAAVIFGLSVFMAPSAVTNFARQNLPAHSWGAAISLFTVVFAVAQTLGPYAAGLLGDLAGDIGISLLGASGLLLLGAVIALTQKPLPNHPRGQIAQSGKQE